MRYLRLFAVAALALALPALAHAQGRPFNPRTPQALGMGNAQIGIGGSYASLFYNPAGLGAIEQLGVTEENKFDLGDALKDSVWELQFVSALYESNADTAGFISDIQDVDESNVEAFLDAHRGDAIYLRLDSTSYFTMKKERFAFGVALLLDYSVEGSIQNAFVETTATPGTDTLVTRKTTDLGGVLGVSYDVVEEWLSLGTSLKLFNRWQTDAVHANIRDGIAMNPGADFNYDTDLVLPFGDGCAASASPGAGNFMCDHNSSFNVGVDVGAMGYLPLKRVGLKKTFLEDGRFQLGVVMQDLGRTRVDGTSFAAPNANGNDIPFTVDLGLGYLQQFEVGRFKLGVDFRDLNRDQVSLGDKISVGAEMRFKKYLTLRAGVNETGVAAGAAIRLWIAKLEGGVIQEKPELPASGRDLRYFASLGFGWYN